MTKRCPNIGAANVTLIYITFSYEYMYPLHLIHLLRSSKPLEVSDSDVTAGAFESAAARLLLAGDARVAELAPAGLRDVRHGKFLEAANGAVRFRRRVTVIKSQKLQDRDRDIAKAAKHGRNSHRRVRQAVPDIRAVQEFQRDIR